MTNDLTFLRSGRRAPLGGAGLVQRILNQMADDLWEPFDLLPLADIESSSFGISPSYDVEETDTHYVYAIDIPGIDKKDIKIEAVANSLVITGERREDSKNGNKSRFRRFGRFQKIFTLPHVIDPKKIEAGYENGVLRIAIPKPEEAKRQQIQVSEGKPGILQRLVHEAKETTGRLAEKMKSSSDHGATT